MIGALKVSIETDLGLKAVHAARALAKHVIRISAALKMATACTKVKKNCVNEV
jgi:hypothetical protein